MSLIIAIAALSICMAGKTGEQKGKTEARMPNVEKRLVKALNDLEISWLSVDSVVVMDPSYHLGGRIVLTLKLSVKKDPTYRFNHIGLSVSSPGCVVRAPFQQRNEEKNEGYAVELQIELDKERISDTELVIEASTTVMMDAKTPGQSGSLTKFIPLEAVFNASE